MARDKFQSILIGHPCSEVAFMDVEPQGDIRQNVGILVHLLHSKHQGQDVLVVLGHRTKKKIRS